MQDGKTAPAPQVPAEPSGPHSLVPHLLTALQTSNRVVAEANTRMEAQERSNEHTAAVLGKVQEALAGAQRKDGPDGCIEMQASCQDFQKQQFDGVHERLTLIGAPRKPFWPRTAAGWVPIAVVLAGLLFGIVTVGWKARGWLEDLIQKEAAARVDSLVPASVRTRPDEPYVSGADEDWTAGMDLGGPG